MGTTKSRKTRRNNSRPTAYSFLSNISLGNENEKPPDPLYRISSSLLEQPIGVSSSESSFSGDEESTFAPVIMINDDIQHHKLTREDSERPIASEKIKRRSTQIEKTSTFMSVFRYYTDKIRQSTKKKPTTEPSYIQQSKHRKALSYAHYLIPTASSYDPFFLDDDTSSFGVGSFGSMNSIKPSDIKREMNEQFQLAHPEIELTHSKIRAIKLHLYEISKRIDLEISSLAHAIVYFEKLVIKSFVTKKNRKLIAACCLFLATKVNEARKTWYKPLLDAIDDELGISAKEIHAHEFNVFADLEFDLFVPKHEFMPHFERIINHLENKSIQEYLGNSTFFEII